MKKKNNYLSKISLVLVFFITLSVIFSHSMPLNTNAAHIDYIDDNSNTYYYIKNVKSGKFLTVQHNNINPGSYIVQWNFTGANNQKWKIQYTGSSGTYSGNYRFYAYNTNYVISIPNGSGAAGLTASLANYSANDNKQMFVITDNLTNAAHRFMTKASNCIRGLVVNNASIYNSAYIVQDDTGVQWSDQWLIEPVGTTNDDIGVRYAEANYNHRLATYPDFDYYNNSNKAVYESTNFVSQCLTASGKNYYRTGPYSDWWYVNKLNHVQNQYFDFDDLTDNWTITTSWYDPEIFRNFWIIDRNCSTNSFSSLLLIGDPNSIIYDPNNPNVPICCSKGDVILIKQLNNNTASYNTILTLYAKESSFPESQIALPSITVQTHSPIVNGTTVKLNNVMFDLIQQGYNLVTIDVEIIHI